MGSKRVTIPEDVLRHLYCDEKLSQGQIATRLGCSLTAVSSKMKLYGIALRTRDEAFAIRDGISIPVEELRRLYFEEKLTQYQIAEHFGCSQGAITRHMKKHGITTRTKSEIGLDRYQSVREDFDGDICLKAHMLGFCKGDIHPWVRDENSQTIRLMTATTKNEQIELFQTLFSPYGHVYLSKPDTRGATHMAAHLNFTFSFLLDRSESIPDWILSDEEAFFAFLAGYTDAEGYIGHSGEYTTFFKIDTYDATIIRTCSEMLNRYGIVTSTPFISAKQGTVTKNGHPYHQDMWRLHVSAKDSLQLLFTRLKPYLKHGIRIRQMNAALDHIAYRNSRPRKKPGKERVSQ